MNRDTKEVDSCQIGAQMSEKYGITRDNSKSDGKEQALERKKKSPETSSEVILL